MIEQIWFKWASKIWENTNISSSSKEFIVTQAVPCKCCIGQFMWFQSILAIFVCKMDQMVSI